jgi:cytochrome c5
MADPHAKMTQATPQEIIIALLAGLFAPLLAIFLIVQLVLGIQEEQKFDTTSEAAQKATLARIKPFAQLAALDANAPKVEKSGQEVYDAVCTSCHASGALGAPKFDSKGDWGPRISQGYDTLVKHAIEGIRQMPPRGGDGDLSDVEVARAVAYLANSGATHARTGTRPAAPAAAALAATPPPPLSGPQRRAVDKSNKVRASAVNCAHTGIFRQTGNDEIRRHFLIARQPHAAGLQQI